MNSDFVAQVRRAVQHRPRLTPLFGSTLNIPERLYEYNLNLFICHNEVTGRFEIHSLDNKGDTKCGDLPFKTLDNRALHYIWDNDIRVHGEDIFRRIEQSEENHKKSKDRDFKNWVESVGKETRSMFAKDAWEVGI